MQQFQAMYPELTEIYSIGKSFLGTDLMVMEITNKATGPSAEKPGVLPGRGDPCRGAGWASAVATYGLAYLLNNYGTDPQVDPPPGHHGSSTKIPVRPKFNPDGSDLVAWPPPTSPLTRGYHDTDPRMR